MDGGVILTNRMMGLGIALALVVIGGISNAQEPVTGPPFRQFTNAKGQSLEGRVLKVDDKEVELERRDGRTFIYKITDLSLEDQVYVLELAVTLAEAAIPEPEPALQATPVLQFPQARWKEKTTDHFRILTNGTSHKLASGVVEKVWDVSATVFPDLRARFEGGQFHAPGMRERNATDLSPDGRFRIRIYLVEDEALFERMLNHYLDSLRLDPAVRASSLRAKIRVGKFTSPDHRFTVMIKRLQGSPDAKLAHGLGSHLLREECQRTSLPTWMEVGMSYYIENAIFGKCRIYQVSIKNNADGIGAVKTSDPLSADKSWVPIVKKLTRRADPQRTLTSILNVNVSTLTPELSGYVFAFTSFLVSDEAKRANYHKLVKTLRDNPRMQPTEQLVLSLYGFPTAKACDEAFDAFIKGRAFK